MTAPHFSQHGTYMITILPRHRSPWLLIDGVPERLLSDLLETKLLFRAKLHAFCILPDHMHIIVWPGERGISEFIHSFKRNSSRNIKRMLLRHNAGYVSGVTSRDSDLNGNPGYTSGGTGMELFTGWQHGFHDRRVWDDKYEVVHDYVTYNAHRHGLVVDPLRWPWSSLNYPELLDGWNL